jgi:hypothetical protein
MIKINLLPRNIYEARTVKRLMGLFAAAAIVVIAIMSLWYMKLNNETAVMKAQADEAQRLTNLASEWASKAAQARAPIPNMQTKWTFFDNVAIYNKLYPALYEELARFTYAKITYTSLVPSGGSSLTIQAHSPSLMDAGRYLLNMYHADHIFNSVTISAVPGYPQGTDNSSGFGGGASGIGNGMPSGSSGPSAPPSGRPSALPNTPTAMYLPRSAQAAASLNQPMLGSQAATEVPETASGTTAGTTYGGIGAISTGLTRAAAARSGFDFTVTCSLKIPITPPPVPGGATDTGSINGMAPGTGMSAPSTPAPAAPPAAPTKSSNSDTGLHKRKLGGGGAA